MTNMAWTACATEPDGRESGKVHISTGAPPSDRSALPSTAPPAHPGTTVSTPRISRLDPVWHTPPRLLYPQVPAGLWTWLTDSGSLTGRLRARCGSGFAVEVIRQRWQQPTVNEGRILGVPRRHRALVREVYLSCRQQRWVYARTVIPPTTLRGRGSLLARLGNRPLGEVLFHSPHSRRGPLQIARLDPAQPLYHAATAHLRSQAPLPQEIWARRSVFHLQDHPLLVCEMFLPSLLEIT